MGPPPRRRRWARFALALGVGAALFVLVILLAGPDQIDAVLDAEPAWVIGAFAGGLGLTAISAARWGLITDALAQRRVLGWSQYWAALLTSRVLGLIVPRNASDLGVRFVSLTGLGKTSPEVAAASVALDQSFDITLLAVWLVPSLLLLAGTGGEAVLWTLPLVVVAATAIMLRLDAALRWASSMLGRMTARLGERDGSVAGFFRRRSAGLASLAEVAHFTRRRSVALALLTFARFGATASMFWAIAEALGLGIDLWTFVLVGAAVQLSLLFAFTPGGLGVMDLGFVGLLGLGGVAPEAVAAFIVGQRAFQYTFFPITAGVSYLATAHGSGPGARVDDLSPSATS